MGRFLRVPTLLLVMLVLCGGAHRATAQIQIAGGIGVSRGTNSHLNSYHAGVGLDLRFRWFVTERIGIGLNTGYFAHGHAGNNKNHWSRFGYLPFAAAADVFFPIEDRLRLYVGAEAGLYGFFASYWDRVPVPVTYRTNALRLGLGVEGGVQYDIANPVFLYANLGLRGVFVSDYWGYGVGTTGLFHFCIGVGVTLD